MRPKYNSINAFVQNVSVPVWKRNRRIIDLCFKQNILDGHLDLFNDQAERFVEQIAEDVGKGEVDLTEKVTRTVVETACRESFFLI